jgi:hypothetical protein
MTFDTLKTEEFSVIFVNLPKKDFSSIKELKAHLWSHIHSVIKNEE